MARELTQAQMGYIVERARKDGRLSEKLISGYLADLTNEIRAIEARLQALRSIPVSSAVRGGGRPKGTKGAAAPKKASSRKSRNTAKNAASRKVQGQYIGFLRQLPKSKRGPYQKLAVEKGREQAIIAIRKALGK